MSSATSPKKQVSSRKNYLRLTVALLMACCLQATAGTSGVLTYDVIGGTSINITDCQTTASGIITIPATIEGLPVTAIGGAAFWGCASITSIVIPENVTSIGVSAFFGCTQLVKAVFKGNAPSVFSGIFDDAAAGFKVYHGDDATGFTTSTWDDYVLETYDSRFSFELIAGNPETIKITDYPLGLESTEIDVPSTIVGLPVTCIGAGSLSGQMLATRITLPDSITRIENSAFYECTGLTTFTIPAAVTFIGDGAFEDAYQLDSLFFKGDAPQRGAAIFGARTPIIHYLPAHAQGFEDDDYPWANIEKYTGLYDFVVYKETIKITDYPDTETGEITIPETLVGKPVVRIGELAFYHCDELTRITLPESLIYIYQEAFEYCSGLTTLTIPTNVTSIGNGAYNACSLDSVFFEGNAASLGVSSLGNTGGLTVYYRDGATGFTTPTWNGYTTEAYTGPLSFTVTEEEVLITDCLTSATGALIIPAQIVGKPVVTLEQSAFFDCDDLTSIFIPDTVTTIDEDALGGTKSLTEYSVASGNPLFSSLDGVLFNKTKIQLVRYPDAKAGDYTVPNTVTSIGRKAFYSCDNLLSITLPASVSTIEWIAFDQCSSLTTVICLGDAPSVVSPISVTSPLKIYYPDTKTGFSSPTWHGFPSESFNGLFTFQLTPSRTIITDYPEDETGAVLIPAELVGRPVEIGADAFKYCDVSSITISNGVEIIGDHAFLGSSATQINIPDSITDIGSGVFSYCSELTAIEVGAGNTDYSSLDGVLMNKDHSYLLRYPAGRIGAYTIPGGVQTIMVDAFFACSYLDSVSIPDGILSIQQEAFNTCANLKTAIFRGEPPYIFGTGVFDGAHADFMIYYFSNSANLFSSPTWKGYPATEINLDTNPLALWLLDYDIAHDTDITQDPNGDGVDLLMEYALNLNPLENNARNTPELDFDNPQPGVISIFYYATQSDVTYTVDTSTDLQTWTTNGVTYTPLNGNYRSAWTPKNGPKQFLRLKIEANAP